MPVGNSEKFISEAIDSILNQTCDNFELLIGDSSEDSSSEIIKSFKDIRIKYFNLKKYSIPIALNYLIHNSKGEYIARMDADDVSDRRRFEMQMDYLSKNKEINIVGTNFYYISEKGKIIFEKRMSEFNNDIEFIMPIYASVLHPTIMCRKFIFDKVGGYNEECLLEDIEFFLRAFKKGHRFYNIQKPLYYYRVWKKDKRLFSEQKKEQYKLGYEYICNGKEKNSSDIYFFRLALLEYYNGKMKNARKYFLKYITTKKRISFAVLRYLPLTLLGNNVVNFLREKRILQRLNFLLNRLFKIDTRRITHTRI